jgi:RNA polymerase sigma factor (sigma-70 family)
LPKHYKGEKNLPMMYERGPGGIYMGRKDMIDSTAQAESELVVAACHGDKEALQRLLQTNWGWLKALVYSVLGGAQDLDDVMQEICLRVIQNIRTLREPDRFRGWLAVLARREAIRHGQGRIPRLIPFHTAARPEGTGDYADDPAEEVGKKELCGRVLQAVQGLPDKYREVFLLAHAGDLTYAQMAEVLEVPITTMQIRLVRARQMIRDQVADKSGREGKENERYA